MHIPIMIFSCVSPNIYEKPYSGIVHDLRLPEAYGLARNTLDSIEDLNKFPTELYIDIQEWFMHVFAPMRKRFCRYNIAGWHGTACRAARFTVSVHSPAKVRKLEYSGAVTARFDIVCYPFRRLDRGHIFPYAWILPSLTGNFRNSAYPAIPACRHTNLTIFAENRGKQHGSKHLAATVRICRFWN